MNITVDDNINPGYVIVNGITFHKEPMPSYGKTPFGELVKLNREDRNQSQKDLAKKVGCSHGTISGIDRGRQPMFCVAMRIMQIYALRTNMIDMTGE